MGYYNDPLISIDQQAPSAMFTVPVSTPVRQFDPEVTYGDFPIGTEEIFYEHPNLVFCSTHNVVVKSGSGSVTVTINFYAGDTIVKSEILVDTGQNFVAPGTTRIGFVATAAATGRNWSR